MGHRARAGEVESPRLKIMKLRLESRGRYNVGLCAGGRPRSSPQQWADREETRGRIRLDCRSLVADAAAQGTAQETTREGQRAREGEDRCGQRGGASSVWTMPGRDLHQAIHDIDRPSTTAADQARHIHAMSRREAVGSRDARRPHHASPESVYAVSRATSRRGLGQCQSSSTLGEKKSCARMSALIEDSTMLQRAPQSVFELEETVETVQHPREWKMALNERTEDPESA